jgi:hypothetical protein
MRPPPLEVTFRPPLAGLETDDQEEDEEQAEEDDLHTAAEPSVPAEWGPLLVGYRRLPQEVAAGSVVEERQRHGREQRRGARARR